MKLLRTLFGRKPQKPKKTKKEKKSLGASLTDFLTFKSLGLVSIRWENCVARKSCSCSSGAASAPLFFSSAISSCIENVSAGLFLPGFSRDNPGIPLSRRPGRRASAIPHG